MSRPANRSPISRGRGKCAPAQPQRPIVFQLRPYHRDAPSFQMLADLRHAAATLKSKILTQQNYNRLGIFGCSTIIRRFGTWNTAITSAGLTPSLLTNTTSTQLLHDIRRVAKKLRTKKLLLCQYTKHGRHSAMVVQRHFKSWQIAARAAGLTPAKFQNIPTSALLADIEQVWRRLGHQPSYSQMHPPLSQYNIMTHCRHFNGFQNALKVFIRHIKKTRDEHPQRSRRAYSKNTERPEQPRHTEVKQSHPNRQSEIGNRKSLPRSINYRLRYLTLRRDNYKCRACGRSPANHSGLELQVDHIIPRSRGGQTHLNNLQSLCQTCNIGKSNLDWKTKKRTAPPREQNLPLILPV